MSAAARSLLAALAVAAALAAAAAAPADAAADPVPAAPAAPAAPASPAAPAAPAAPPAPAAPISLTRTYTTRLHEGSEALNTVYGPFYIPDGQCSGVVDDVVVCTGGVRPDGVKVAAEDTAPFPRVTISADFKHASVLRSAPCLGEAAVRVELACP